MHFEYHKKSDCIVSQAKEKYPHLASLSDESIEARYWLLLYLEKEYGYDGIIGQDENGKPKKLKVKSEEGRVFEIHWSISHSAHYVAFTISESECGIDIAEYKERDSSLLDKHKNEEYHLLGGRNWENFYKLWTAKEAILKKCGEKIEDIARMKLTKFRETSLIIEFEGESHTICSMIHSPLFISYTC